MNVADGLGLFQSVNLLQDVSSSSYGEPPHHLQLSVPRYRAIHVAKFPLFSGTVYAPGIERNVHRDILNILSPLLCQDVRYDAVIVPDASDTDLVNMISFMYGGR